MPTKKTQTIALYFSVIIMAIASIFWVNGLILAWTAPTAVPPAGNVAAPLNVGSTGQSKAGGLILNTGGAATGLIVNSGNVGIGTAAPGAKLEVSGNIIANTPTASNHVATKGYVDAAAGGGGCYISYSGGCLAGFTNMGSAGTWGYCVTSNSIGSSFFRPPGGGCGGVASKNIGTAYVCCQ